MSRHHGPHQAQVDVGRTPESSEPHAIICPQCSAPLPPMDAMGMMHCHYCNATIEAPQAAEIMRLAAEKRAQSERDREREARRIAEIRAHGGDPQHPQNNVAKSSAAGVVIASALGVSMVVAIVVAVALFGRNASTGPIPTGPSVGPATVTQLPIVCHANETLTVQNASYTGGAMDTAITAENNCHLTIINSKIKANTGISASLNTQIVIKDSVISATTTAIDMGTTGTLVVQGASSIDARNAIVAGMNATISMTGTKVTAIDSAILGNLALNVTLSNVQMSSAYPIASQDNAVISIKQTSHVTAKNDAIGCGSNARIDIEQSVIEAGGAALALKSGAWIAANGSTLTGGSASISTSDAPVKELLSGTTLNGPRMVSGRVIGSSAKPAATHSPVHIH